MRLDPDAVFTKPTRPLLLELYAEWEAGADCKQLARQHNIEYGLLQYLIGLEYYRRLEEVQQQS